MLFLKFKVTETDVKLIEKTDLPSGNLKRIKCSFDLDSAFDNMVVRASFNSEYETVENGECYAPMLEPGRCSVGVYGYITNSKNEYEAIISPAPVTVIVTKGSYNKNDIEFEQPSPSELDRHYELIKELVDSGKMKGDNYILTDDDKTEIAEIVKTECMDEIEAMIDNSGVLDI